MPCSRKTGTDGFGDRDTDNAGRRRSIRCIGSSARAEMDDVAVGDVAQQRGRRLGQCLRIVADRVEFAGARALSTPPSSADAHRYCRMPSRSRGTCAAGTARSAIASRITATP